MEVNSQRSIIIHYYVMLRLCLFQSLVQQTFASLFCEQAESITILHLSPFIKPSWVGTCFFPSSHSRQHVGLHQQKGNFCYFF